MRPLAAALAALFAAVPLARDAHAHAPVAARIGSTLSVTTCSESALRDAVDGASNGDTIDLTTLSSCTITLAAGEIAIAVDNLTVQGPADISLTLSGNHASRVFHHTGHGLLTLDHLAITAGNDTMPRDEGKYTVYYGTGGAVHSDGDVTLSSSSLTNSSVCYPVGNNQYNEGYGGGMFAEGNVSVIRSTVSGNTACGSIVPSVLGIVSYHGGAGGGIFAGGHLYVSYSTISGNQAYARGGGGVYGEGNITLVHSAITGNGAVQKGGGVAIRQGDEPIGDTLVRLTVRASTISGNTAMDGGGLASLYGSPVDVSDSTIAFNTASRETFDGWRAGGGGVCVNGYSLRLTNSIVANNTAHNNGQDITLFNIAGPTPPIAGDHNVVMSSSPAAPPDTIAADPGLLPLADHGGQTQTHALAPGSVAVDAGRPYPGLFFDQRGSGFPRTIGAAADIGAFESGTPPSPVTDCSEAVVRAAIANASDGGVVDLSPLSHCTITLADGAFTSNVDNIAIIGPADRTLIFDGDHRDRVILHSGGGILTLDHLDITRGYVDDGKYAGGAVFSSGSIVLASSKVTRSMIGGPADNALAIGGGGLYALRNVTLDESVVSGNSSHGRAAGICALVGDVTIRNSTLSDNHSDLEGGGVFAPGCFGVCTVGEFTTTIENSTISGNSAGTNGGGVHVTYGNLVVRNSTIAANAALDTVAGGGIFVRNVVNGVQLAPAITIASSIVATNTSAGPAADIGSLTSLVIQGDHDIITAMNGTPPSDTLTGDPGLLPLGDYGGPTPTHALATGSLAIDRGSNPGHFASDQRGADYPRVFGADADIGAFELSQPVVVDRIFTDGFD
ncbi:choice-of-anchor Q domain-containing protein [Dokdonella sp.]|uniref:choice-of-anchor Q domain-containing protein n=1 Tax=Dokdonella sp. TaxID=2291710 RepID=UPI0025B7B0D3|nr:choice-of-anchor Q domain-containing protein [Dokdonella sp.]